MTGWNDPDMLGTLAAAYAGTGDFDDAIKWQQKAVDLISPTLLVTLNERQATPGPLPEPSRMASRSTESSADSVINDVAIGNSRERRHLVLAQFAVGHDVIDLPTA
jgi:hypothetical protein